MVNNCTRMISIFECVCYYDNGRVQTLILHKICIIGIVIVVIIISNNFYQWIGPSLAPSSRSTLEREKLKLCAHALIAIAQLAPSLPYHKQNLHRSVELMASSVYFFSFFILVSFFLIFSFFFGDI